MLYVMFIYKTAKFAPVWTTILKIWAILYTKPLLVMLFATAHVQLCDILKLTGIRPMTPMPNRGPLECISAQDVKFLVRTKVIENDMSLVVISLSEVGENEFVQTL